jgi:hypothetical protein
VVLLRQTGPGALDTVYAEDGQIFLQQLYDRGLAHSLLEPYAGYGHLLPRVLVAPVGALPAADAAAGLALAAATTTALLALLTYRALRGHMEAWPLRALAASALVLLPLGQEEVWNVVANVHWFLVPVAAILLLFDPTPRWETAVVAAVVFVTATSDPIAVVLVPLAVVRLTATVPARTRVVPLALGAGLAVQALVVAGGSDTRGSDLEPIRNPVRLLIWGVFDLPGRTVVGTRWASDIDASTSWLAAVAGVIAISGLAVLAWRRLDRTALLVPLALVATGGLLYVAYVGVAGTHPQRYAVPGGILLVVAAVITLDRLRTMLDPPAARRLLAVVGALTLVVWTVNLRIDTQRSAGPRWSDEVDTARLHCGDGDGTAELTVVPGAPWVVEIACDRID